MRDILIVPNGRKIARRTSRLSTDKFAEDQETQGCGHGEGIRTVDPMGTFAEAEVCPKAVTDVKPCCHEEYAGGDERPGGNPVLNELESVAPLNNRVPRQVGTVDDKAEPREERGQVGAGRYQSRHNPPKQQREQHTPEVG